MNKYARPIEGDVATAIRENVPCNRPDLAAAAYEYGIHRMGQAVDDVNGEIIKLLANEEDSRVVFSVILGVYTSVIANVFPASHTDGAGREAVAKCLLDALDVEAKGVKAR